MSQHKQYEIDVSIIIPVYNGEQFIAKMLNSLEQQTFLDFEVIFVNDGSRDRSGELLDQAVAAVSSFSVRVIHQENQGVSAARNVGLREAVGRYVCFVDVDDLIAVNYLDVLRYALDSTGTRVAASRITRDECELSQSNTAVVQRINSTDFLRKFLYQGIQYHICACMFDRNCFTERDLWFPAGYRYSEDVFVLWQVFAAEEAIAEVDERLYFYYNNPSSAMNAGIDIRRLDAIELMKKLEPIIAERNAAFSPEFSRYAVARHHWSILWQAASRLDSYRKFKEYCSHFTMKKELVKLLNYPELRISASSLLYLLSPFVYYHLLRTYVKIKK